MYAIGVGDEINVNQLRISANGGQSNDRVLKAENYVALSEELRNLTRQISEISAEGNLIQ